MPLRDEVGLLAYWDSDHETEYDEASLRAELAEADLEVTELRHGWSELWAVAEPR